MITTATFQSPPTTRHDARLYQRAKETIRLASLASESLKQRDGTSLDSNKAPGVVISDFASITNPGANFSHSYVAGHRTSDGRHYEVAQVSTLAGEVIDGASSLKEILKTDGGQTATIDIKDGITETVYTLTNDGAFCYRQLGDSVRAFDSLTVSQDKASGSLFVEQTEITGDARTLWVPGDVKQTRTYGPDGPTRLEQNQPYRQDSARMQKLDAKLAALKALDNGPDDLNPEPGLVVTSNFGSEQQEASLRFNPASGALLEGSIGFGKHEELTYSRDQQAHEHFLLNDAGLTSFDRSPDSSLTIKEYERLDPQEVARYQQQQKDLASYEALPWFKKLTTDKPYVRKPHAF